jgi:uncharacterized protein YbaP (TraB family)
MRNDVNGASRCTSSAANGTVLQAIVYGATFAADLYDRIIAKRNERKHRE